MKKLVLLLSILVVIVMLLPFTAVADPGNANANANWHATWHATVTTFNTNARASVAPGQIKKAAATAPSVTLRCEGGTVFADATGFPAGTLYSDWQSRPTDGNSSTTGVGVTLYTTSDGTSTVSFPVSEALLFPDFPRSLTVTVWVDGDMPDGVAVFQVFNGPC